MLFAFVEFVGNQGQQGVHGLLGLLALGLELQCGVLGGSKHHDTHDAFGVHAALTARKPHLTGIRTGQFGELGRGPGVEPEFIADGRLGLDHVVFWIGFEERCWPLA